MAVIVRQKDTGDRYILIGSGFGAFKASRPGVFFGNWNPIEESGEIPVVLVCNSSGATTWIKSALLEVVSVDGLAPSQVLGDDAQLSLGPGCQEKER
jgi:hypothetical protein